MGRLLRIESRHSLRRDVVRNPCEPSKMTEAHCEFQRRLSEDSCDYWWKHEGDAASMLIAVESAAEMYARCGRACFATAVQALDAMTSLALVTEDYDLQGFGSSKLRLGLALARVRQLEARHCHGFAEFALQDLGCTDDLKLELEAMATQ